MDFNCTRRSSVIMTDFSPRDTSSGWTIHHVPKFGVRNRFPDDMISRLDRPLSLFSLFMPIFSLFLSCSRSSFSLCHYPSFLSLLLSIVRSLSLSLRKREASLAEFSKATMTSRSKFKCLSTETSQRPSVVPQRQTSARHRFLFLAMTGRKAGRQAGGHTVTGRRPNR